MSIATLNVDYMTSNMFYNTPFQLLESLTSAPFGSNVYVVSDSKYKEYKQKQAGDEIALLEKRAAAYEEAAMSLRKTVLEIKQEAGLLPKPEDDGTTTVL